MLCAMQCRRDNWAHHKSFNDMPAQKAPYVQAASMTHVLQRVLWLLEKRNYYLLLL